jgi:hypothetical protein
VIKINKTSDVKLLQEITENCRIEDLDICGLTKWETKATLRSMADGTCFDVFTKECVQRQTEQ